MASTNRKDPQAQKQALIDALNEHRVNTIGELRRIERIFASIGSSDLTQPMTAACRYLHRAIVESTNCLPSRTSLTPTGVYYVNSNSMLTELRGLTRNYPFR